MLQVVLQTVLSVILGLVLLIMFGSANPGFAGPLGQTALLFSQVAELVVVTISIVLARRLLDRRTFASLGVETGGRWLWDFAAGLVITFVMMAFIFSAEWTLGWLHFRSFAWQSDPAQQVIVGTAAFLAVCLMVGWKEELMSRGYHLQTLASGINLTWGWILSSSVFGLLHLANPHANLMAVAGIVLAGLFLGYAYIRTGQLWLSIGLHTGWNLFEGVVFGFPVSGLSFYNLARTRIDGPVIWTGGEFGPEAGLILVPALMVGFVLIHWYSGARRQ